MKYYDNPSAVSVKEFKRRVRDLRLRNLKYGYFWLIYEIVMVDEDKSMKSVGWYPTLREAMSCLKHNELDIREFTYDAAVIVPKPCGLYQGVPGSYVMYFRWSDSNSGYVPAHLPDYFDHIAF